MKQDLVLPRQKRAFGFCAFSAPAVAAASHLPWPWVLTLSVLAAALTLGLGTLEKETPVPAPRFILLLQAAFAAVLLWQFSLGSAAAFPDDNTWPYVPLTLLAVSTWAAGKGAAACARAQGVMFFFLAALYLTVFFCTLREADLSRLMLPRDMDLLPFGVVLLLPFYTRYLVPGEREEKPGAVWLALQILLPTLAALACTLVPGSDGKFYTMVKSLRLFSFAQRMEPLVSVTATAGWFSALCLLQLSAGKLFHAALGRSEKTGVILSGLLALPGILWGKALPPHFLLPLGAVFCVILPLLTQVFGSKKFS